MRFRRAVWLTPADDDAERSRQAPRLVRAARGGRSGGLDGDRADRLGPVPAHLRRGSAGLTGPTDGGDDARREAGEGGGDPATWALPADAAVAAGAGVSAGGEATGGERPGAVAAGDFSGGEAAAAGGASGAGGSAGGVNTGIPPLDSALGALPIDDQLLVQRPEILVGGAFAVGFLLARILKAIGRG